MHLHTHIHRHQQRHRDRKSHWETLKDKISHTHRQIETGRARDRHTNRHTHTHTDTHTHTYTHPGWVRLGYYSLFKFYTIDNNHHNTKEKKREGSERKYTHTHTHRFGYLVVNLVVMLALGVFVLNWRLGCGQCLICHL